MKSIVLCAFFLLTRQANTLANFINANPSNYTTFINGLLPGDTLNLSTGNYMNQLNLNNLNGNSTSPIVISGAGNTTVFYSNACCNTVNITNCSFIVIENFKIDGQNINYVDGVKAGGGGNSFAHDIVIENLLIINNGGNIVGDNQTVGISSKCAAWNWTIRSCTIIAAGTGLYLGNSDGTCPFVNGLIENNLVINSKGYNMEIKEQLDTVRDNFSGTSNDFQKTIIRYNVWSKDSGATPIGVGDGSRPCILMDNFPSTGYGANDMYEVYGNFFFNNPTEALMQVTGNTSAYDNIFVNQVAPPGYATVVINNHNGFPPREMNIFHNTILSTGLSGGISLSNPNLSYVQDCYANAVFNPGNPVSGFSPANDIDNITDMFANAGNYIDSSSTFLSLLNLYPKPGQLQGTITNDSLFTNFTNYDLDFNGDIYDWTFRGAYSGSGINYGWHLQLDTMPIPHGTFTAINKYTNENDFLGIVFPVPATNSFQSELQLEKAGNVKVILENLSGQMTKILYDGVMVSGKNKISTDVNGINPGFYLVNIQWENKSVTRKILIQR